MRVIQMYKMPEYTQYNNEKNIALLDNSAVAFLEQLKQHGIASENLLSPYDVILVPDWVLEEVCDSPYRERFLKEMVDDGYPVYRISESNYVDFTGGEDINLFKIVQAAVSQVGVLRSYLRKNVEKADMLDMEDSAVWLPLMHQNWPISGGSTSSGRTKKKNAGEISLTILAEVFSWYYPIITSLTVLTQDSDAYTFVHKAQEELVGLFPDKHPITVTYKSNDFVLCDLFRSGQIQLSDVSALRRDARKVTYTQQRPDKSTALITERLDNSAFERLIQDMTANIIF